MFFVLGFYSTSLCLRPNADVLLVRNLLDWNSNHREHKLWNINYLIFANLYFAMPGL
jgi:hypothetical protein